MTPWIDFWQKWLFVAGLLIIVFGLVMALMNGTALFEPFNQQIDPIFWESGAIPSQARTFQAWIYGVSGAIVTGWGIFLAFIARHPFRERKRWAWTCLLIGLSVWYLVDTSISLAAGVIFNTLLLLLVVVPLIFTWKAFSTMGEGNWL